MQEYPLPKPDARKPDTLILFAALAPSSHNTQPWLFEVDDNRIHLFADRRHQLGVCDPAARELTISCGCALMNLRVAAAEAGCALSLDLLPDPDQPDLLATATVETEGAGPDEELALLFPAIFPRRTFRKRFEDRPVSGDLLARAAAASEREGAWCAVLESSEARHEAADLVARGDEIQWSDTAWRNELASWMHARRRGDGLVVPPFTEAIAHAIVRSFDMGDGVAARDRELADGSPVLAVIGTADDGAGQWLAAGMALERVLLLAQLENVQASYLNQAVQVPELRPQLAGLTGRSGQPQVLLRMGYARERTAATPRRMPSEFLRSRRPRSVLS